MLFAKIILFQPFAQQIRKLAIIQILHKENDITLNTDLGQLN